MPFRSSVGKAFNNGHQYDEAANLRQTTGYDTQERLLLPERDDLKQERQKQLERGAREREREQREQRRQQEKDTKKEDKARKREDKLFERKAREYDRAREQREKAARTGVHPFSEVVRMEDVGSGRVEGVKGVEEMPGGVCV
ncbi:MAG: hypothetical protein Q9208_004575 [Pyrenodesmia sp. 3 TL-2023]